MKRTSIFVYVLILCLSAMLLVQCASKGAQVNTAPERVKQIVSPDRIHYHKIYVAPFVYDPSMNDHHREIDLCKSATIRFLNNQQLFEKIIITNERPAPDSDTLIVETKVTEIRIVSASTRVWGGAFAGKSNMTVNVRLLDSKTNKMIDQRYINSSTNPIAASYTFGASDRNLPEYIGEMIGYFVTEGTTKQ